MNKREAYAKQLEDGIAEMEAAVERLRDEIHQLREEREALLKGNRVLEKDLDLIF
jgi:cell division protein FtsB